MPGTITFKPIQANLTHDTSQFLGMDPYCSITVDGQHVSGKICPKGGSSPHWEDEFTLPASQNSTCVIEVKDKSLVLEDKDIGSCKVNVDEILSQGKVCKWYELNFDNKFAGEILLEAVFHPETPSHHLVSNLAKQVGMGVGLLNLGGQIQNPSTHTDEEYSQFKTEGFETGISKQMRQGGAKVIRKRSNDLDVPSNREAQTRPNYMNEKWGKKNEEIQENFLQKPEESRLRSKSEQQQTVNFEQEKKGEFHSPRHEEGGLDLWSDLGPHTTGYDKDLWSLPENLKDLQFKSHPPQSK